MNDKAFLDGKKVVPTDDLMAWATGFDAVSRRVAHDEVGDVRISTVFLGLNHSWGDAPPLWFETMIFGGEHNDYTDRYETWEQAEAGHKKALALVDKNGHKP